MKRSMGSAVEPLSFWTDEPIFFDPVTYTPKRSWEALSAAAKRTGIVELVAACEQHNSQALIDASRTALSADRAASVERYLDRLDT